MLKTVRHLSESLEGFANKATYTGAGASILGWIAASDITASLGMVVAVGGFVTNFFFKWREDRRRQKEHEVRMAEELEKWEEDE
jgi:hypothetical protein